MLRNVNYKHSEWEPIALFSLIPLALLASQDVPANNLNELIDYAKKDPGKVTYATLGPGTASHLAGLRFEQVTGTKLLPVPYKSTNDVHQDLLGKRVDLFFDGISQALPRAQAGTLKMLGVASTERLSIAADFPTIREQRVDLVSARLVWLRCSKGHAKSNNRATCRRDLQDHQLARLSGEIKENWRPADDVESHGVCGVSSQRPRRMERCHQEFRIADRLNVQLTIVPTGKEVRKRLLVVCENWTLTCAPTIP